MARPPNKQAILKKRCKDHESDIKNTLEERGIKYHLKSLDLAPRKDRMHLLHLIETAIDDVKDCVIDETFLKTHGLPSVEKFSDAQALYVAMIVPELYPDIDHLLEDFPNTPELLFPALARDKLNKARVLIENADFNKAELLIEEVAVISEMIVTAHRYVKPEPYKLRDEKNKLTKVNKGMKTSKARQKAVKKSSAYIFSLEIRKYIEQYALNVKLLLEANEMSFDSSSVAYYCVKGMDIHALKDISDFWFSLSKLAFDFELKHEAYCRSKMVAKSETVFFNVQLNFKFFYKKGIFTVGDSELFNEDDIFVSLATIRRHLAVIISQTG